MSLIRSICVSQILCLLSLILCAYGEEDDDNLSVASMDDTEVFKQDIEDYNENYNEDDKDNNKLLQKKTKRPTNEDTTDFQTTEQIKYLNLDNSQERKTSYSSQNNTKTEIELLEEQEFLNSEEKQKKTKNANSSFNGAINNVAQSEKVGLKASKLFYKINNNFLSSKISNFSDTKYLHVFAFNVGQANCIVLRCGDEVVIVDAGTPSNSKALGKNNNPIPNELEINIFPQVDKVLKNTKIKAVFITHPHTDHYNLIEYLFQRYWDTQKESCRLFLGGPETEWRKIFSFGEKGASRSKTICINGILKKDVTYVTSAKSIQQRDINNIFSNQDIVFSFIVPEKFVDKKKGKENGLSFLMKVTHKKNNCSFLFTGDAEGNNLQEAIGSANQKEILTALLKELPNNKMSQYINTVPKDDKKPSAFSATANRSLFNNIGCVFVPHHGSRTEDSGRFISYLEDRPIPPAAFIISSEVSSSWDNLPQRGAWESVSRQIKHPAHFVTYHNGTNKKIKLTKKRVYITEAAPGGVYWLVSDGKTIWMYNAYRKDPNDENSDLGFFPITTVSDNITTDCEEINKQYNKNWKMSIFYTKSLDNLKGETLRQVCKGSDRLEKAYNDLKKSQ